MRTRWPWQERLRTQLPQAIEGGAKSLLVTGPTGSGKTWEMIDILEWCADRHWPVALFTNRQLLVKQTSKVLEEYGVEHGMRAAGHELALLRDVQLCMLQTELSRVYRSKQRELHDAKLVIIDEPHLQKSGGAEQMIRDYLARGSVVIGFTATPLDLGHLYDELMVAGTMSECREHGALVEGRTFAPDEPDLKHIKNYTVGSGIDLTEKQNVKAMMRPGIFGRVYEHWKRLNPDGKPSLLFAPGVKESLWFAEQFHAKGVRWAHIDSKDVWVDGDFQGKDARDDVLAQVRSGEIAGVSNRFVLREGIDLPEIYHLIFATVIGSLSSYIQSGGRALRAHHSIDHVIIQDHGGNYHRHGTLNADREWSLGQTNYRTCGERVERMRNGKEQDPITCPVCFKVRASGNRCPQCGHVSHVNSRMVVQKEGVLRRTTDPIHKPRIPKLKPNTQKVWDSTYWRERHADKTFRQAEALFFIENYYYPPRTLANMPVEDGDWWCKIRDVPKERLRCTAK